MKRFRFRLQRVLDLESRRSDASRREFASALRRVENARALEAECVEELDRVTAQLQAGFRSKSISPTSLRLRQDARRMIETRRLEFGELIRREEELCEKARVAMLEQRRRVLALERLKDKEVETWRRDSQKAEADALDEFAAQRFGRRIQESLRS